MRRDRGPVLIAGSVAVASCGLLAVAVWRGWLGADVGRGANFCEAARDGFVRQPANTFSNVGFVVAGLLIAWHAGADGRSASSRAARRDALGSGLAEHRRLATAMACLVVLLGPGSAAMHATQSAAGGALDVLSMYLVASMAVAYATMRLLRGSVAVLATTFAAGVAFCELVGSWHAPLAVVMTAGNAAFGLLLVAAVTIEVFLMRRPGVVSRRGYAAVSLASILVAFAIWNASKAWLCQPHSLVQGHAIWHVLGAVSAYFLYRYYASESVTATGSRSVPTAGTVPAGTGA